MAKENSGSKRGRVSLPEQIASLEKQFGAQVVQRAKDLINKEHSAVILGSKYISLAKKEQTNILGKKDMEAYQQVAKINPKVAEQWKADLLAAKKTKKAKKVKV